jgi:phosphatidate cytidylyltransferase
MSVSLTAVRLGWVVLALFASGALLIHLVHRVHGVDPERQRRDWLKCAVYAAMINALWAAAYLGQVAAAVALAPILVLGSLELVRVLPRSASVPSTVGAPLILALALGHLLVCARPGWQGAFAFVVLVTAATDSFAELVGRLLGGRRLCPRLSPGKTVAGFWGGLTMAVAVSMLLGFLLPAAHGVRLAAIGLATAFAAVGGDLLFSAVKRAVGVKDFSTTLPGHGGILDRFDSLLLAAPVSYWTQRWLLG